MFDKLTMTHQPWRFCARLLNQHQGTTLRHATIEPICVLTALTAKLDRRSKWAI